MDISNSNNTGNTGESIDVDILAKTYVNLLKTPVVSFGKIITDDENVISIYSEWSLDDITTKERTKISKNYTVLKSTLSKNDDTSPVVYTSPPVSISRKLTCFSNSGLKMAIVVNGKPEQGSVDNGAPAEILQIYDQNTLYKTYDLKEIDKHKGIYTTGFGSTMVWNKEETKLMYLAEKKIPKPKPYFTTYKSNESEPKKDDNSGKGEEFAFRQSWGETLNNCYESVIVILDIETDDFTIIELPDKVFPSDLQWQDSTSIVGVAFTHTQWRLGLVFCSNRESRIFQIRLDGSKFRYINKPNIASCSPRVSPDGTYLVWQERKVLGPHQMSRKILGLELKQGASPVTIYSHGPPNQIPIYSDFPVNCWSYDGTKLFIVTSNEVDSVLLSFSFINGSMSSEPQVMRQVSDILSIGKTYILGYRSCTAKPHSLILIDNELNKTYPLNPSESLLPFPLKNVSVQGVASPQSFYYGPTGENIKPGSVPLVVSIHGGPHAVILNEFSCELTMFLKLGFGVLSVNFVGSTGGMKDVTESLLGRIGEFDVNDCQAILMKLLAEENTIDQDKIVIFGGSHSGFLGAHLTSKFPDTYKAAVLRNPVTDVLALTSVSDITDWAFEETGVSVDQDVTPIIRNLEDAKKFMDCSPIHNVGNVKAATLLLLGSEDLRVPMSQGLAYYRALKAAKKITEVRVYPDTHSLRKVPVRFDSIMHTLIWYLTHLKMTPKL